MFSNGFLGCPEVFLGFRDPGDLISRPYGKVPTVGFLQILLGCQSPMFLRSNGSGRYFLGVFQIDRSLKLLFFPWFSRSLRFQKGPGGC